MKAHSLTLGTALAVSLFVSTCNTSTPISSNNLTTDAEASVQSLSWETFTAIKETALVKEILTIDNPAPETLLDNPAFPVLPRTPSAPGIAKKAGDASFVMDTIEGTLRIISTVQSGEYEKTDTILAVLDSTLFDAIEGNESVISISGKTVFSNELSEHYAITDIDGDGLINRGIHVIQAELRTTKENRKSDGLVTTQSILRAEAGLDNDFSKKRDNELLYASWIKCIGNDTVTSVSFTDADGDGFITASRPGSTHAIVFDAYKPLHPLTDYSTVEYTVKRTSEGHETIVSFCAEKRFLSGRIHHALVTDLSGNTTLTSGDTVLLNIRTTTPETDDSVATVEFVYTTNPGNSIGDVTDNALYALSYTKNYRYGLRTQSEFSCTFIPPVPHGEDPESGIFDLKILYENGKEASFSGTFTRDSIDAVHTATDGTVLNYSSAQP